MKKVTWLSLPLLLLLAGSAFGAITVDTADGGGCAGGGSCTKSFTVAAGSNHMVVGIHTIDDTDNPSSATWNAVSMTGGTVGTYSTAKARVYYLYGADEGAHNMVFNGSGWLTYHSAYYISLTGAAQEAFEDECTNGGIGTSASCTISTVSSGSMVVGGKNLDTNSTGYAVGADQTRIGSTGSSGGDASYGLNDATHSYTWDTSKSYGVAAASFKVAGGAPPTTNKSQLIMVTS